MSKDDGVSPPHQTVWRDSRWRTRTRRRLTDWFDANARDLPWRVNPTPYRIWISEIMLQQTQVATVIPYYQRFLKSFPTAEALADADEQSVLSHWEGLGYYRRARSMHATARIVVDQHDGRFPETFDEVIALPGVGRYTAGAILSISRDQRLPILEGNTQRLFSRLIALTAPATETKSAKLLWEFAEAMLPTRKTDPGAGKFNQAAMELGALLCTPKSPSCDRCPIATSCQARKAGLQFEIPGKVSRVSYEDRSEFAMVIRKRSKRTLRQQYLVRPLPKGVRWAGLWDFPRTIEKSLPTAEQAAKELSRQLGGRVTAGAKLTTIKHAVTKYRISLHVHEAKLHQPTGRPPRPWRYVTLSEMFDLPMSVTARKITKMLGTE